jgi:hypothetical protein
MQYEHAQGVSDKARGRDVKCDDEHAADLKEQTQDIVKHKYEGEADTKPQHAGLVSCLPAQNCCSGLVNCLNAPALARLRLCSLNLATGRV